MPLTEKRKASLEKQLMECESDMKHLLDTYKTALYCTFYRRKDEASDAGLRALRRVRRIRKSLCR